MIRLISSKRILDEKYEVVLNEVLPEVFAIVKDTARRFNDNAILEVSAQDYDRNLAADMAHIEIKGIRLTGKIPG
jgi:preprotein translocase subunit SecA